MTKATTCLAAAVWCLAAASASASGITFLYSFTGGPDGANPGGPLLIDANGNLYGTATGGGAGNGTVFELSPAAAPPWTLTVLHAFSAAPQVGTVNPGLAADRTGALYGTTYLINGGLAFRLAPPQASGGTWRYSPLAVFPGLASPGGSGANGSLAVDAAGDVTGTTQYGGDQSGQFPCQCGVVYSLPASRPPRTETVLSTFMPLPNGNTPAAGLTPAGAGLFYGTTYQGGTGRCYDGSGVVLVGCGTVFQLAQSGAAWTQTTLCNFAPGESGPTDPVTIGPDGALYGYANLDVFRLARRKDGGWTKLTIYSFPGGIAGTAPTGRPLFDAAGNLDGTTRAFGIEGDGLAFRLSPPTAQGQGWTETTLATIAPSYSAPQPAGGLSLGRDGTLYGATTTFGESTGAIFEITP